MRPYCYRTDVNMNIGVMWEITLIPIYCGVHTSQLHEILIWSNEMNLKPRSVTGRLPYRKQTTELIMHIGKCSQLHNKTEQKKQSPFHFWYRLFSIIRKVNVHKSHTFRGEFPVRLFTYTKIAITWNDSPFLRGEAEFTPCIKDFIRRWGETYCIPLQGDRIWFRWMVNYIWSL